ncbi:hypothetical protein GCM10020000_11840 [Streptomyces olivoverticillatus]
MREVDGLAGGDAAGDEPVGVVFGDLPGRIGGPGRLRGARRVGGGDRQGTEHRGLAVLRPGGAAAVQGGVQDVDGRHVGQRGDHDPGQLPGGLVEVEGGADQYGRVGDQGQPALGLGGRAVPVGDVDDRGGQAQHVPAGVLQPVVRDQPGPLAAGGLRAAHDELVHQGGTGPEHLEHGRLDPVDLRERQHVAHVPAGVGLGGQAVDALQGRVDHDVPQLGVHDGEADRGLGHQAEREGEVPFGDAQDLLVGGDAEGVEVAVPVLQPHVAEFHQPGAAVLVPGGEDTGPLRARHHLAEELEDRVPVLLGDEQPGGVLPQRLTGAPAEEPLGGRGPQDDPTLLVEHHRGHAEHVEQAAGGAYGAPAARPGSGRVASSVAPIEVLLPPARGGAAASCSAGSGPARRSLPRAPAPQRLPCSLRTGPVRSLRRRPGGMGGAPGGGAPPGERRSQPAEAGRGRGRVNQTVLPVAVA